ncbi:MAG: hypothetical protein E6G83_08750 [Alphaproteobacteria bacterium]|nr:MAG: hypothetical protein E6G83_08750 [Alphaproteobacteria bacterium]
MQAPGVQVEVWFQDETRIGQKNSLTPGMGATGSRPVAPKDLGFASAYLFGAVCPSQGKAAALIMPICNTAAMNPLRSGLWRSAASFSAPLIRWSETTTTKRRGTPAAD